WVNYNIPIGEHVLTFEVNLFAINQKEGSFVAIDDLELVDCETKTVDEVVCPADRPFHCYGTSVCLSLDQRCDLHQDCLCGEDELDKLC
ncbi:ALK tyrosine kinase receptor, partial [Biomphalaria glabrata]